MSKKLFSGLVFCFSGKLSQTSNTLEKLIKKRGGKFSTSITKKVTHFITTQKDLEEHSSNKIIQALQRKDKLFILNENFIHKSIKEKKLVDEKDFKLDISQCCCDFEPLKKKIKVCDSESEEIVKFDNFDTIIHLEELMYNILQYLSINDILPLRILNKYFNKLIIENNNEMITDLFIDFCNENIQSFIDYITLDRLITGYEDLDRNQEIELLFIFHKLAHDLFITPKTLDNFNKNKNRLLITKEKLNTVQKRQFTALQVLKKKQQEINENDFLSHQSICNRLMNRILLEKYLFNKFEKFYIESDGNEIYGGRQTHVGDLKKQLQLTLKNINSEIQELTFGQLENNMALKKPEKITKWLNRNKLKINQYIRSIHLNDVDMDTCECSWLQLFDITEWIIILPDLQFWKSKGMNDLSFSKIKHFQLRSISLITGGLPKEVLDGIMNSYLPNLIHLDLWLGVKDYGLDFNANYLINNLLTKEENGYFPSLEYLGLRNCDFVNEIIKPLFESSIAKRLRYIDLSLGTLCDEGIEQSIEILEKSLNCDDFICLEALDFSSSYISGVVRGRLLNLPIIIDVSNRRTEEFDSNERYVTLTE
ncbi:hypothetical protein ABK040_002018 [Willaertia magna]